MRGLGNEVEKVLAVTVAGCCDEDGQGVALWSPWQRTMLWHDDVRGPGLM